MEQSINVFIISLLRLIAIRVQCGQTLGPSIIITIAICTEQREPDCSDCSGSGDGWVGWLVGVVLTFNDTNSEHCH